MLYLTCTTITSVDFAHYGVSRAKDWVSVDCGTNSVRAYLYCQPVDKYSQLLICQTPISHTGHPHITKGYTLDNCLFLFSFQLMLFQTTGISNKIFCWLV